MKKRMTLVAFVALLTMLAPGMANARWMNPATGRFMTMDSFEGGPSDPLSLHKYLYAGDNSINRSDPSGHNWLSVMLYGQQVHRILGEDFISKVPGGIYGPSIGTILTKMLPGMYFPQIALFPDLVDTRFRKLYEIKPIGSYPLGVLQLAGYIAVFNYFDPAKGWTAGSEYDYEPPTRINLGVGVWANVYPPIAGVILYQLVDLPTLGLVAVGIVATANKAELLAEIGTVLLNAMVAAF